MSALATTEQPQHLEALARANEVRLARAELKRRVGDGELDVAEVILENPWEAQSMSIADLLMSQKRWGVTRCRRLLQSVQMQEQRKVGAMTDRQRRELARLLGARA